jgi:hypothetical protein
MKQGSELTGKERSFARGVLLTIVTLGLYSLYWHYKAYQELIESFDLDEFPMGLFVASLIPLVNLVAMPMFMSRFIDDLNGVRSELGLSEEITLGSFLGWYVLGSLIVVGPFVAYHKLQTSINDVWTNASGEASAGAGEAEPASPAAAEA